MTDSKLITLSADVEGKKISLETGVVAKQSDGSVILRVGDTMILATAVSSKLSNPAVDSFVPLTVNYKERTYAAGKIPGGFFKREARPTKKETLASRLTDRSLRPLFPEGFTSETNVTTMVMSYDGINDADVLSITAASASLMISCIPFAGPISAVRIGRVEGKFIVNPTKEEMLVSDMNLIVSGTLKGILMVEGEAQIIAEEDLVKAIESAKPHIDALCNLQIQLAEKINPTKFEFETLEIPAEITKLGNEKYRDQIVKILQKLNAEGKTIIMVTHEPELAEAYAEKVYWLRDGKVEKTTHKKNGFKVEAEERALHRKHGWNGKKGNRKSRKGLDKKKLVKGKQAKKGGK